MESKTGVTESTLLQCVPVASARPRRFGQGCGAAGLVILLLVELSKGSSLGPCAVALPGMSLSRPPQERLDSQW